MNFHSPFIIRDQKQFTDVWKIGIQPTNFLFRECGIRDGKGKGKGKIVS